MDLAEGHLAALEFLRRASGWHAINLGTGRGHSVLEVVRAFEAVSGVPVKCRVTGRRVGDVAAAYAKVDKAEQLLGWKARRGLGEMCASAWRYQAAQQSAIMQEQQ
jgi:UDP-glucose 4-epimerase